MLSQVQEEGIPDSANTCPPGGRRGLIFLHKTFQWLPRNNKSYHWCFLLLWWLQDNMSSMTKAFQATAFVDWKGEVDQNTSLVFPLSDWDGNTCGLHINFRNWTHINFRDSEEPDHENGRHLLRTLPSIMVRPVVLWLLQHGATETLRKYLWRVNVPQIAPVAWQACIGW